MNNENYQPSIFEAYLPSGLKIWINLEYVVSVQSNITTEYDQSGPIVLQIEMINGVQYELTNDEAEPFTMWADQFIYALNTFNNQENMQ